MSNPILNYASQYLKTGWSVIPLVAQGKTPALSWQRYTEQRPTTEELAEWFGRGDKNVGIVTGAISNIVVVDVDSLEGLNNAKTHGLTSPVYVTTGKGRHYYFRHPGRPVSNAVKAMPGLDIRADGGYVLAPPSLHPNGKRYLWNFQNFIRQNLPEFPTSIFEERTAETHNQTGWIAEALSSLTKGNRNDTFARVVGKLHRNKWSAVDILELLQPHCERVALPLAELQGIIDSITRYEDRTETDGGRHSEPERTQLKLYSFADSKHEYDARAKRASCGTVEFPTGYKHLDRLTGGLRRGEIFTVAARTGTGKTNFLLGLSQHLCSRGRRVVYFSTEMSFDSIWSRYITLVGTFDKCKEHQFFVCDDFAPDISRLEEALARVKADVFIFDHINHIGDEQKLLSEFYKGLKMLARKMDAPCVVAAQLNRQADWVDLKTQTKVIPRLSMIKGSGTIEQAAAQVLLLSEIGVGPDQNDLVGNLDKNRYGEKDIISFVLKKNPYRLEEVE